MSKDKAKLDLGELKDINKAVGFLTKYLKTLRAYKTNINVSEKEQDEYYDLLDVIDGLKCIKFNYR